MLFFRHQTQGSNTPNFQAYFCSGRWVLQFERGVNFLKGGELLPQGKIINFRGRELGNEGCPIYYTRQALVLQLQLNLHNPSGNYLSSSYHIITF